MKSLFDVSKASHNLGCWAFCAGESPCNACARNASALRGSPLAPRLCTILCSLHDLAPGKGSYCAATLAEWPRETAADQQPLTEHLQHQTGTHSAPTKWL